MEKVKIKEVPKEVIVVSMKFVVVKRKDSIAVGKSPAMSVGIHESHMSVIDVDVFCAGFRVHFTVTFVVYYAFWHSFGASRSIL